MRPGSTTPGRPGHRPSDRPARLVRPINAFGFIETKYRKVTDGVSSATRWTYLTADEEDRFVIAQANAPLTDELRVRRGLRVLVRRRGERSTTCPAHGSSRLHGRLLPRQMVSVATAMDPFLGARRRQPCPSWART
ncbi:hypothetical protein [Streptomyces sp. KL116D]|uniref:hypothetical protein n=1 Tax=Streptomyces sp. KL116D TaxID=3045152 RepID=UPI00355713BA